MGTIDCSAQLLAKVPKQKPQEKPEPTHLLLKTEAEEQRLSIRTDSVHQLANYLITSKSTNVEPIVRY